MDGGHILGFLLFYFAIHWCLIGLLFVLCVLHPGSGGKNVFSATLDCYVLCVVCFGLVFKCIGWWTYFRLFTVVFYHTLVFARVIICFVRVASRGWRKNVFLCVVVQMWRKKRFFLHFGRATCCVWCVSGWCSNALDGGHILGFLLLYFTIHWCLLGLLFVLCVF